MSLLNGNERAVYVRRMFARVAARYDLMNRLMTGGMDRRWRREVIRRAGLHAGDRLLDLGAGTGDLAREAERQQPGVHAIAADFTLEMMIRGRKYGPLAWAGADALCLPFPDETFDVVVSGFLMRNVTEVPLALAEQFRVLKPGGRIVILDSTPPRRTLLWPFIWLYLHAVIPLLGRLVTGLGEAYRYLPESTERFLSVEQLAGCLQAAGFKQIGFKRLMGGTIAIHYGLKST